MMASERSLRPKKDIDWKKLHFGEALPIEKAQIKRATFAETFEVERLISSEYYVFTGSRRNIKCRDTMYQPYSLWSNEGSGCILKKSLCTEIGQILFKMRSGTEDSLCRCDYTNRYAFVIKRTNRCFCLPSEEDCSCYPKQCGSGYILNADYQCILKGETSEVKCKDIKNQRIDAEKEKQIHKTPKQTTDIKSGKDAICLLISAVLIIILGMFLPVCCCEIRNNQREDKSGLFLPVCCCKNGNIQRVDKSDSNANGKGKKKSLLDTTNPQSSEELLEPERDKTITLGNHTVVAAIDLGSTSSGYASSTTAMFKTNPLDIRMNPSQFVSGTTYLSTKTETCILMEKNGTFVSLGHVAKDEYADLLLNENADNYSFFEKFKMQLYYNENISDEMMIKDVKGCEMKAIDVFSSFIYALMVEVKNGYQGLEFDDIQWVLTVPAVWSDKAKYFMRHSVEKKVKGERLIITLEPDAVSIYYQYLHDYEPTDVPQLDRRYVVVDMGGGTVDITAHEKTDDGDLIELCSCNGADIGGTEVDKNFLGMFSEIVGGEVMDSLLNVDEYKDSFFDILREVENFKRNIFAKNDDTLSFKVPFCDLDTLCRRFYDKSLHDTIGSSKYSNEIFIKKESIIFLRSSLSFLFLPVVNRISTKVRQVIDDLKDLEIKMILIAGGLSRSPVILRKIEKSFEGMQIISIPQKYPADLAVVKGAVLYGHRPHFISSRITEYTYGRVIQPSFISGKHDPAKRFNVNGTDLCRDVFEILVLKNTRVNVNETIQKEYEAMHISQKEIRIAVYTTKRDNVDYVDDSECKLFCEVTVPLSESSSKKTCVIVDFVFGYTEFRVTACDKETKVKKEVSVELK